MLGRGGAGVVREAVMTGPGGLRKPVALKILYSGDDAIRREARIGGFLRHQNLVDVFDIDCIEGQWVCAMERCDDALSRHVPLPPSAVVEVGLMVCAALDYAHEALKLVHLDLKPGNLLVSGATVKVADLGIARAEGFDSDDRVRGTPLYMAPEQRMGLSVDARTDVYALGVTLLELATGDQSSSETLSFDTAFTQVLDSPTPDVAHQTEQTAQLAQVLERCLAIDPADRWPSMQALAQALAGLHIEGPSLATHLGVAPKVSARRPGEAPSGLPTLHGRRELLEQLRQPHPTRWRVLHGAPGVGKSRLAAALCTADTRWVVAQTAHTPSQLVHLAAASLGIEIGSAPLDAAIEQTGAALAALGPILLVLDDTDNLPPQDLAALVDRWLTLAPSLRVLVTQRARVEGHASVLVPPLSNQAAVSLLRDRALERGVVHAEDDALERLADRLDRIPLALVLAAGRLGVLSPDELIEHMAPVLLRDETEGRHGTLDAAIDITWAALSEPLQAALSGLALLPSHFSTELATAVLGHDAQAELHALHRQGCLEARQDGRFRVFRPIRDAVQGRAVDPSRLRQRAVDYLASRGTLEAFRDIERPGGERTRAQLLQDVPHLEWACRFVTSSQSGDLLRALWMALQLAGPYHPVVEASELLLKRADSPGVRTVAGQVLPKVGRVAEAAALIEAGLEMQPSDDERILLRWAAAKLDLSRGNVDPGIEACTRLLPELTGRYGFLRGTVLNLQALLLADQQDWAASHATYLLALREHRAYRHVRLQGIAYGNISKVLWAQGDLLSARAHIETALDIARQLQSQASIGIWMTNLGIINRRLGDIETAEQCYRQAIEVNYQMGARRQEAVALANLGVLMLHLDAIQEAQQLLTRARRLHRQYDNRRSARRASVNLAQVQLELAHYASALELLMDTLAESQADNDLSLLPPCHARLAELCVLVERFDQAREHLAALETHIDAGHGGQGFDTERWATWAELHHAQGRPREALLCLQRAIDAASEHDPDSRRRIRVARHRTQSETHAGDTLDTFDR